MKKCKTLLALLLTVCMLAGLMTTAVAQPAEDGDTEMKKTIEALAEYVDGEQMFDYLSYVYLGWRTTGGSWQNQVIDDFIVAQLKDAGYTFVGAEKTELGTKGSNDMSAASDDDYSWVTYYNVGDLTWDPEYAKLSISTEASFDGVDALIDRVNVESYAFNPTTDTYKEHYGVESIDEMWQWITEKDESGNRINVLNGKEAELNKRCHLAWNSCFTEAGGTKPADAVGITGEVVYIGAITGRKADEMACTKYPTVEECDANLAGKVLLTDSSLRNAFTLAQRTGAIAVMSTASLNSYSTPRDEAGNIIEPFVYSARYASGAALSTTAAQTESGKPIVEWQFSNDQKAALLELLEKADGTPVYATNISIGRTYAMNDETAGGKGQAVTMAEIKGATKPDERIIICAHVQEPGSNDNATGVASQLGLAVALKKMVDEGVIERPERTITFLWGDEMNLATLWLNSHPEEKASVVAALDMDMVGEDPEKTGGVMRIEKTPDPSAVYNYTLDVLPWETDCYYDDTFADPYGDFVRLPDSHTLWGAGSFEGMFQEGFFLNDLYMYAAQGVINYHDDGFRVDVCPYEGGSDHSRFLAQNVPALLTWHMTDYTYHSSVDTLNMSSAREMENVGITTLATGLMMANATDDNEAVAREVMDEVFAAAMTRFDTELQNTKNHRVYTLAKGGDFAAALANEKEVLQAWADWYDEAIRSAAKYLLDAASEEFLALQASYQEQLAARLALALAAADEILSESGEHGDLITVDAKEPTCTEDGYTGDQVCENCREVMEQGKVIPATGHDYKDGVCVNCGEKEPGETPKTGDTTPLLGLYALMAASAAAGYVLLRKRKAS